MLPNIDVSWFGILIAGIASMIIGALWYSPLLFGKAWMRASGFSDKDLEKANAKGMRKSYLVMFVGALITAYILGMLIYLTGLKGSFIEGAKLGALVWLGFVAVVQIGNVLWDGKSMNYFYINAGYWLVNLVAMGGILGKFG